MTNTYIYISTGSVIIIGDNFVSEQVYTDFKRYSKFKTKSYNSTNAINKTDKILCIIDCSFNNKIQDDTIDFASKNDIKKVIILNHWKRNLKKIDDLIIVQLIVFDIYGNNHPSFSRMGPGNGFDNEINYCSLISESIRRIHESKVGFVPNTYIYYTEENIKYLHVSNLYNLLNYTMTNVNKNSEYEIYDEYRHIGNVIDRIKNSMDYQGNVVINIGESRNNYGIKRLPLRYTYNSLDYNLKQIYRYLTVNNDRFLIY